MKTMRYIIIILLVSLFACNEAEVSFENRNTLKLDRVVYSEDSIFFYKEEYFESGICQVGFYLKNKELGEIMNENFLG